MGLYISDDYGLGNYELALATLATHTIEQYLESSRERNLRLAKLLHDRRQRVRPRHNEARWTLPPK